MAITYNPYNWEIRPGSKKTIKKIRKKDKNHFEVCIELKGEFTREELLDLLSSFSCES